ncbi:hypothetical protein [Streptomyces sp. Wb2n-11]|uniref:hypothetical protein n=1 Tax=Streptomyces sp. Wb2n-11 TaxID=1030533 RepID=UPI000A5CF5AB|nr:hypothetical protein [Streptomyces sp. Wb2n-11]
MTVRIPQDLFEKVDARAKDPARAAERGYALNGRMVMIAALAEEFKVPDDALTGAKSK